MTYRLLADLILILHFCFILFVMIGGLLMLRWRRVWFFHLPAVIWGFLIQQFMWSCPLTYLESSLRRRGGEQAYSTGFIEHYVSALVYPEITPTMHMMAGVLLILINFAIYLYVFRMKTESSEE